MNSSEIILYTTPQGDVKLQVIVKDETVWLTQKAISELFGVVKSTINEHLTNIYQSGELEKAATVRKIRTVQNEAGRKVTRNLEFYNLDAFLQFNDYSVLKNAGSISAEIAKKLATEQFEKFRIKQDSEYESDFDKEIKRIKGSIT